METFSASLALGKGNPPVTGGFLLQRPVTRSFDVFFYLHLDKQLSKQSRHRWFERQSRSLWHHCNDYEFFASGIHNWVWSGRRHDTEINFSSPDCDDVLNTLNLLCLWRPCSDWLVMCNTTSGCGASEMGLLMSTSVTNFGNIIWLNFSSNSCCFHAAIIIANFYCWQSEWFYSPEVTPHPRDVMTWKHFPHYWLFVKGNHRWLEESPHKSLWMRNLDFLCAGLNMLLNKQSSNRWSETPRGSCNVIVVNLQTFCRSVNENYHKNHTKSFNRKP